MLRDLHQSPVYAAVYRPTGARGRHRASCYDPCPQRVSRSLYALADQVAFEVRPGIARFASEEKMMRADPVQRLYRSLEQNRAGGAGDRKLAHEVGEQIVSPDDRTSGAQDTSIRNDVVLIAQRTRRGEFDFDLHVASRGRSFIALVGVAKVCLSLACL